MSSGSPPLIENSFSRDGFRENGWIFVRLLYQRALQPRVSQGSSSTIPMSHTSEGTAESSPGVRRRMRKRVDTSVMMALPEYRGSHDIYLPYLSIVVPIFVFPCTLHVCICTSYQTIKQYLNDAENRDRPCLVTRIASIAIYTRRRLRRSASSQKCFSVPSPAHTYMAALIAILMLCCRRK